MHISTNSEKTDSALRSISIAWLSQKLFGKYAPEFSDKLNWKEFSKLGKEERKDKISEYKNQLKEHNASFHNDLCGALNLIMFAAASPKIKKLIRSLIKVNHIARKFHHEALRHKANDGNVNEPINLATWFCIHEDDLRSEWERIKQYALSEHQKYYSWSWHNIKPPTKSGSDEDIKRFEDSLIEIFRKEKDDKQFPVKVSRLHETKTFIRYCVSTAKDPIETFLAQNGEIDRGNDPTANTFLIDHYYKCDTIRIAYPDVIDQDRVADLFAEHVLGSEISPEEPKVFLRTMRKYSTREKCNATLAEIIASSPDIKDIKLKAIRFTIAESESAADARRRETDNKKRKQDGLPQLPRLKAEVFDQGDVFDEIDRSFNENARRDELVDVFELDFRITLYNSSSQMPLGSVFKDEVQSTSNYTLTVTPRKLSFKPRIQDIPGDHIRSLLRSIQDKLDFSNEPAMKLIQSGEA